MNFFQKKHTVFLLDSHESKVPLDTHLRVYFKKHTALGANDRRIIAETVYGIARWNPLVSHLAKTHSSEEKIEAFFSLKSSGFSSAPSLPSHLRAGFPEELYTLLSSAYGKDTDKLCKVLNETAPITIRTNFLKITREKLLEILAEYSPIPTKASPYGITVPKRENFFGMASFKEGFFEVQDEGSQLVADLVAPSPGDHVLDFCAGSGGKTLAFAHKLEGKGQLYLHDVREHALLEAKKRLRRAGIQNAQLTTSKALRKKGMQERMDWVLLDVPCSGTGTLRRNPDMKEKITAGMIAELTEKQRVIFDTAFLNAKINGYIVYATCSVLPQENEDQIAYFLENYPIALVKEPLKILPTSMGMDGFFGAVFKKLESKP